MTAFIIPDDASGRILTFDVIENELHESIAETTDHPVEQGVNPSDHVRVLPDRFTMVGYITKTPIIANPFTQRGEFQAFKFSPPQWTPPIEPTPGSLFRNAIGAIDGALFGSPEAVVTVLGFPEEFDPIYEMYEQLLELQGNAVLSQVLTPIRIYDDMLIERVAAPRIGGDSGVSFALDVRKLRIVESGQVAAPPVPASDVPGGNPLQNKGGQGAKPPADGSSGDKEGSIAFEFLKGKGVL